MITDISINIITLMKKCFIKKLIKILKSSSETANLLLKKDIYAKRVSVNVKLVNSLHEIKL